jgi:hypothetical protein
MKYRHVGMPVGLGQRFGFEWAEGGLAIGHEQDHEDAGLLPLADGSAADG